MKNCSILHPYFLKISICLRSNIKHSNTVFHHQMKHLEVLQKYSAARRIFNSLLSVSSGDETLRLMLDILHQLVGDLSLTLFNYPRHVY